MTMPMLAVAMLALGAAVSAAQQPVDERVAMLLAQMTLPEKIAQLFYSGAPTTDPAALLKLMPDGFGGVSLAQFGSVEARNAVQVAYMTQTRLGIPVSFYSETLRSAGAINATIFAAPALIGCSWNVSLAEAIGRVVATEAWASGADRSFSPVLQVLSDARWGRFYENFGESDLHVAYFGAAVTRGLLGLESGPNASTYLSANFSLTPFAKHAIAYGMSNADGFAVSSSSRELHEVYMKPWREFATAGGRSLMLSHPAVNGVPMHAHSTLLAELRALPGMQAAAADTVVAAAVDRATGNVLRAKFAANLFDQPAARDPALQATYVRTPYALALATDAVHQSAVLLTNTGGVLPLTNLSGVRRIAVIGPNGGGCPADATIGCQVRANMVGGYAFYSATSSNGAVRVPTVEDEVRGRYPAAVVTYNAGGSINSSVPQPEAVADAVASAVAADVVVLVLGDSACLAQFGQCSCGEGADRVFLDLSGNQQLLLQAVLNATGNLAGTMPPDSSWTPYTRPDGAQPVVVVLIHGRPVTFGPNNWLTPGLHNRGALVSAWLPSEAGAAALLDLIVGAVNFGGRTSVTWPQSTGHLRSPGAPWLQWPDSQGPSTWLPPREGPSGAGSWAPLFPLGHGLSYSTFALSGLVLPLAPVPRATATAFNVSVTVANTGPVSGAAVVFVTYSVRVPGVLRHARKLAAILRVNVAAERS